MGLPVDTLGALNKEVVMRNFEKHKWWIVTCILTVPLLLLAGPVPNTFAPNTSISSQAMNANFLNVTTRIDTLENNAIVKQRSCGAGGTIQVLPAAGPSGLGPMTLYCAGANPKLELVEPVPEYQARDIAFGLLCAGMSATKTMTIRNVGTIPVTLTNFREQYYSGVDNNFPDITFTTTCGPSLAFGATCTITVTFTAQTTAVDGQIGWTATPYTSQIRGVSFSGAPTNPAACP